MNLDEAESDGAALKLGPVVGVMPLVPTKLVARRSVENTMGTMLTPASTDG
jgi:hypothetical protein